MKNSMKCGLTILFLLSIMSISWALTITAPQGGETLGCGYYTIRWTVSGDIYGPFRIEYYCDGTWHTITDSTPGYGTYPDFYYNWYISSNTCCNSARIRITDAASPQYPAYSNYFSINCGCDCEINITSPSTGSSLGCGSQSIRWTSENTSGSVRIEYYCDGDWHTIVSSTTDDGAYSWSISQNTCCDSAMVRITDVQDSQCNDYTGFFSINCGCDCEINVTSPSSGSSLGCGAQSIRWTSENTSGSVRIEYYCDGTWHTIVSGTSDDGAYSWTIQDNTCCDNARIRITDVQDANCSGESGTFSINCGCDCEINVTSPSSGSSLGCGAQSIRWTSENTSGSVRIEYYCDGTWHTIRESTTDDGAYSWTIPDNTCCDNARIRITDVQDANCRGESGTFSINCGCDCEINVTSPSSGSSLGCGAQAIRWNSENTSGSVRIEYYCDGTWHTIVSGTSDDGAYSWTIPDNTCCDNARIRITDVQDSNCTDESGTFSINCGCDCEIIVTSPSEGSSLGCGPQSIRWTSENTSGSVRIDYYCYDTKHTIVSSTSDDGSYTWTIPQNTCCDFAAIMITDFRDPSCYGTTGKISINCGCCPLTVLYPNGGDTLICDEPFFITWTSAKDFPGYRGSVKIEYLCDSLWYSITSETPDDGSYEWFIPSDIFTDSTCCDSAWIKITDLQDTLCYDMSDSAFTINCGCDTCCEITVISPNGGENIECGEYEITWTSECTSGNVRIQYDCDGVRYTIVSSTPDDGSYTWIVPPNTCCERARIKITDVDNPRCRDYSDDFFTIDCECEEWFWKKGAGDSIRHGIPDFDQKQYSWQIRRQEVITADVWSHCGPVAVANCLWWWDSRIEADHGHEVDLVKAYGQWDDKSTQNVKPFVEDVAQRCRTNIPYPWTLPKPRVGTDIYDMRIGINSLLFDAKLDTFLYVHQDRVPTWTKVVEELERCQDVILLLGLYGKEIGSTIWKRIGGHYVTMAGFNLGDTLMIGISDPYLDHAEGDRGDGNPPHPGHIHNNSNLVSGPHGTDIHDPYWIQQPACSPYAVWQMPTYPVSQEMFTNFLGQNDYRQSLYPIPAYQSATMPSTICVNTEYALYVSPYIGELGSIGGTKTDYAGNFVEGWEFKLSDSGNNLLDVTFTDRNGRFLFGGLQPATYVITDAAVGQTYTIELSAGEHIRSLAFAKRSIREGERESSDKQPLEFRLDQNYPNPFNPETTITYQIPEDCLVTLTVYDLLGRERVTLINKYQKQGVYQIKLNSFDLPSGIYFYKIKAGKYEAIKKMIYIQ